jgi:hypothetical protein
MGVDHGVTANRARAAEELEKSKTALTPEDAELCVRRAEVYLGLANSIERDSRHG